jgi:predicted small lipoprotein YifL
MISRFKLSLTVGTVLLLSACGQRGPLYLPSEAPQNQPAPADSQPETPVEGLSTSTDNEQEA